MYFGSTTKNIQNIYLDRALTLRTTKKLFSLFLNSDFNLNHGTIIKKRLTFPYNNEVLTVIAHERVDYCQEKPPLVNLNIKKYLYLNVLS